MFTTEHIPDQTGRTVIITGANSGLGKVSSLELARKGAIVVMAVRNSTKGTEVANDMKHHIPDADIRVRKLDLSSLASVRTFAEMIGSEFPALDTLINNAGVMRTPYLKTADGFEMQLGTNYLGHFALTSLLLPLLQKGDQPRVVTVSSTEHKPGHMHFDDLMSEKRYAPRRAYQQSKLANTLFGLELDRRLRAIHSPIISVLAHPGVSATNLVTSGPTGFSGAMVKLISNMLSQPVEQGALPQLYAATAPDVRGGDFYGPSGMQEMRGPVTKVHASDEAKNPEVAQRLWHISEALTGVQLLD
jgi:NAD(P)-dependent dehydrogenase (short-subunit alcohol dehydrogenase family)